MTATAPPAAASAADANDPLMAVVCPSCQAALAVPQALGGDRARCPLCLAGFTVPSPPRPPASRSDRDGDAPTAEESRLSAREERSVRRGRRNIVMLVFGTVILLVIVLVFGSQKPKKRR